MKTRRLVLASLAAVLVAGAAFAIYASLGRRHAESVNCGNYMASIGCGAKIWALDNDGRLASDFGSMSNELATTKVLVCPGDPQRFPAKDWASLDQTNCSYEIVAPGMRSDDTRNVYFRCRIQVTLDTRMERSSMGSGEGPKCYGENG